MEERLPSIDSSKTLSRRRLLRVGAGAAAAVATAGAVAHGLEGGVKLSPSRLYLRSFSVERRDEYDHETFEYSSGSGEWKPWFTNDGRLVFEPVDGFFERSDLTYVHRTNDPESIRKARDMGADIVDIDANYVRGKDVYPEHGKIPQLHVRIGGLDINVHLPMVVDVDEMELRFSMPESTYAELIEFIGTLGTSEHPIAVATELKRGDFDTDVINEILSIHQTFGVPVILKAQDPERLEAIMRGNI